MTDETTTAETVAAPKSPGKPRAPKLMASIAGAAPVALLKYAFPVKAPRYTLKVNGVDVDAAATGGRGKEYTYMLINNTSFYVAGVIPPDTEVSVDFPDGYVFDDALAERKSYYKPKKPKADGENPVEVSGETAAEPAGEAEPEPLAPDAPKASRKRR